MRAAAEGVRKQQERADKKKKKKGGGLRISERVREDTGKSVSRPS